MVPHDIRQADRIPEGLLMQICFSFCDRIEVYDRKGVL